MQNKTKATLTLTASAICAAGTLPISPLATFATTSAGEFMLGMFNHGFIAATIGGLADWFAVTALFHKPLGIGYRTELLRRNRARITDAIIEYVSNDLLNTKNIMDTVREENAAKLLIDFFDNYNGRAKVKKLFHEVLSELFANTDSTAISMSISPIIEDKIKNIDVKQVIDTAVNVLTKEKHSRKILTALLQTAQKIIQSEHMQESILKKIAELREAYEGDSAGRALVLASMNLTDERILSILNENVERKINDAIKVLNLRGLVDNDSEESARSLINAFNRAVKAVTGGLDVDKIQAEFRNIFSNNIDVSRYIKSWIDVNVKGEEAPEVLEKFARENSANAQQGRVVEVEYHEPIWKSNIDGIVDAKIDEFVKDVEMQETFDRFVKGVLENMIEDYHGQIPALVRERLDKFSDDDLTKFVESRVSDDLQMIRINGSVCGGIVGVLLYIVATLLGQLG